MCPPHVHLSMLIINLYSYEPLCFADKQSTFLFFLFLFAKVSSSQ